MSNDKVLRDEINRMVIATCATDITPEGHRFRMVASLPRLDKFMSKTYETWEEAAKEHAVIVSEMKRTYKELYGQDWNGQIHP